MASAPCGARRGPCSISRRQGLAPSKSMNWPMISRTITTPAGLKGSRFLAGCTRGACVTTIANKCTAERWVASAPSLIYWCHRCFQNGPTARREEGAYLNREIILGIGQDIGVSVSLIDRPRLDFALGLSHVMEVIKTAASLLFERRVTGRIRNPKLSDTQRPIRSVRSPERLRHPPSNPKSTERICHKGLGSTATSST
jgi:hypothetical protein